VIEMRVLAARAVLGGLIVVAAARIVPTMLEIRTWRPAPEVPRREWRPADRNAVSRVLDSAIARSSAAPDDLAAEPPIAAPAANPGVSQRGAMPALELRGVTGPPWRAVVRGLPGTQGDVVVRAGDRFEELMVMRIDARGVLAVWQDSTWVIGLGREGR
jgi:hypothetical protein